MEPWSLALLETECHLGQALKVYNLPQFQFIVSGPFLCAGSALTSRCYASPAIWTPFLEA